VEDYRRHWEERFERLDDYLRELKEKQKEKDRRNGFKKKEDKDGRENK